MKYQRGQTLIETAIFLPLVLLSLTAIIYFSQYGVLQGRAVQAVRYATLVSNGGAAATKPSSIYTIESMYHELFREGSSAAGGTSDPGYPSSAFACGSAGTAARLAMYQQETLPGGMSALPTAPPFFRANATPSAACSPAAVYFPNGSLGNASSYLIVQYTNISALKNTPSFLQSAFPQQYATAGMSYTMPAAPGPMMYCSQAFGGLISGSVAGLPMIAPNVAPTLYGSYPTPDASPTARPNC